MSSINDFICKKNNKFLHSVKSYVVRQRYMNKKKKQFILSHWKKYGIDFCYVQLNFSVLFPLKQYMIVEIGFGDGHVFVQKVLNNPHINFIGIEVYPLSIFSVIKYATLYKVNNLKIIFHDAIEVLIYMIPNHSINILQIFFPDPWFKLKHHKRRLINNNFIHLVKKKIIYTGYMHIITDCHLYSKNISILMSQNLFFKRVFFKTVIFPLCNINIKTKFEKKAILLNNNIFDYKYQLNLK
ncbi:tRNA (guanine-N(7)-)-methyltransferase [Buchnera aphidicola (Cinara piceae)]|uniref:tRNA (guanine-N(7)-)-methyltransferase n=1 Tax=Buchnera aphidicola (Cinara piceae) TaxID=1660043 RepID=A0A803GCX9_9GAMM|nr:tRNA (guanosine(46)-N7)-methyltransferase TrmB [Buchnera aphidicola]VFP88778.1 tRNA (guanine-N(7)-)-methyltransferase [Buchnera aphidicola (Cinara piceae)]